MPDRKLFDAVNKNINKFEVRIENYILPSLENAANKQPSVIPTELLEEETVAEASHKEEGNGKETKVEEVDVKSIIAQRYSAFANKQQTPQPKLCMWTYMSQDEITSLLSQNKDAIRETIDKKMGLEYPKGISRILAIELMYSVVRFCQKYKFNYPQSGTLLSLFYLTHQYFLSSFNTSVKMTYGFFKEYMLLHCFECPPDSMQIFNYNESTQAMKYFCSVYLQNLPLIRMLTLPNFGFYLDYEIQPDPFEDNKGGKGKKGK